MMRFTLLPISLIIVASQKSPQVNMPFSLYEELCMGSQIKAQNMIEKNLKLVNSQNSQGYTALIFASSRGNVEFLEWLIKNGADVNAFAENQFTALHLAHDGRIAHILIQAGADPKRQTSFGMTPLQWAASEAARAKEDKKLLNPELEVFEELVKSGVPLDMWSALCLKKDDARKMIASNLTEAVKMSVNDKTLLHVAARNGDIETAKLLLGAGMKVDVGRYVGMMFGGYPTPLFEAVTGNQTAMVRFLCEHGADPDKIGRSLTWAMQGKSPEIAQIIRKYSKFRNKPPIQ